jgi:uncharacterized protein YraI
MHAHRIGGMLAVAAVVALTAPAFAASNAEQTYSFQDYGYQFTPLSPVDLRAGPDTSAAVVGILRPGMPLTVGATTRYGWVQVNSPVGAGWAYGSYLTRRS